MYESLDFIEFPGNPEPVFINYYLLENEEDLSASKVSNRLSINLIYLIDETVQRLMLSGCKLLRTVIIYKIVFIYFSASKCRFSIYL